MFATEDQELPGQPGSPLRRVPDLLDVFSHRTLIAKVRSNQIAVTNDDRQDVVEVMGHAADELSDHFHFLGLNKMRYQPPAFGPFIDILHRPAHRGSEPKKMVLQDVIRRAALE